jgi:hypothetical protein
MIRVVHPGYQIRILIFTHPRIPGPDPKHCNKHTGIPGVERIETEDKLRRHNVTFFSQTY